MKLILTGIAIGAAFCIGFAMGAFVLLSAIMAG